MISVVLDVWCLFEFGNDKFFSDPWPLYGNECRATWSGSMGSKNIFRIFAGLPTYHHVIRIVGLTFMGFRLQLRIVHNDSQYLVTEPRETLNRRHQISSECKSNVGIDHLLVGFMFFVTLESRCNYGNLWTFTSPKKRQNELMFAHNDFWGHTKQTAYKTF